MVIWIGLAIWILFAAITLLGGQLHYEIPNNERPIVLVTLLLIAASVLALVALKIALGIRNHGRDLLVSVILFSIAFRLVQLFAPPFQEVDSYRYIWDGLTVVNGHNPYRYSPYQVLNGQVSNKELTELHKLALKSESYYTILNRVHYSHVRTLYPPVSQAVFSGAMLFVPATASVDAHLIAMKTAITLFDLGVLFLLAYLLSLLRINLFWCMAYGWNPIVIKEFSNSGHLDSIAVFFTLAAITLIVRFIQLTNGNTKGHRGDSRGKKVSTPWWTLIFSSTFLAAGFASKIYPIILLPICLVAIVKSISWRSVLLYAVVFSAASSLFFWPMIQGQKFELPNQAPIENTNKEGLSTFLRHWQMNEWAYMLVYQNLRELSPEQKQNRPWFRVVDEATRKRILKTVESIAQPGDAAYVMSRIVTLGIFGVFYGFLLWRFLRSDHEVSMGLLSGCFWILAIFFCLQPTQNPWYWTWAVPFLPFCRNRAWLVYSTFLLVYYLRFSMVLDPGPYNVLGQQYTGTGLFDYVMVWLEHLPVFIFVAWHSIANRKKQRSFDDDKRISTRNN